MTIYSQIVKPCSRKAMDVHSGVLCSLIMMFHQPTHTSLVSYLIPFALHKKQLVYFFNYTFYTENSKSKEIVIYNHEAIAAFSSIQHSVWIPPNVIPQAMLFGTRHWLGQSQKKRKNKFCFDSMMLLLHTYIWWYYNYGQLYSKCSWSMTNLLIVHFQSRRWHLFRVSQTMSLSQMMFVYIYVCFLTL